ncbi:MAG TPA: heme exporter protein CcmB [Actinomycetota bacterium]|nr:heme exporter protein CcmB [Actinomycetota bacterium]
MSQIRQSFLTKTFALAAKDLRVEMRGRETLPPMVAFAIAVTLLLAFTIPASPTLRTPLTLPTGAVEAADVLAGFMWVTILFAGLIGFARTFEVERQDGALDAMLLVPLDRSGLFLAKAIANFLFVGAVELFVLPAFVILFSIDIGPGLLTLLLVVILTNIGFVSVGTLFAALAAQTRSRELVLPILALPALLPIFIASVTLTSDLLSGIPLNEVAARGWFVILIAYDVIFGTIAALAFEAALD